jgi:hypothetical protein
MFTMARYMAGIVAMPAKRRPIASVRNSETFKTQTVFLHALVVVCNLKAQFSDAIMMTHVSRRPTANESKGQR